MTFVREKLESTDELPELDEILRTTLPRFDSPSQWLVDRRRNLYFMNLGGGALEMPYFLVLVEKGSTVIRATAQLRLSQAEVKGALNVGWTVESFRVPSSAKQRVDELTDAFVEALRAYGAFGDTAAVKAVDIELPKPTFV